MLYDSVPIPSKNYFYKNIENNDECLDVYYITTEQELSMGTLNMFNQGKILPKIINECVCIPNKLNINDLLMNDFEFLILFLKESAYGNVIETNDLKIKFNTHDIEIKNIEFLPNENGFYEFIYLEKYNIKFTLPKLINKYKFYNKENKINYYLNHVHSINDNEDKNFIKQFLNVQSIQNFKLIKDFVETINFGVNKKTFCISEGKKVNFEIKIDESLFGLTLKNIHTFTKQVHEEINFLVSNEGSFTYNDVLKMPVHIRRFYVEKQMNKLAKMKEELKNNKKL